MVRLAPHRPRSARLATRRVDPTRRRALGAIAALSLYVGAIVGASPAAANADAALKPFATGEMAAVEVHDAPTPTPDTPFKNAAGDEMVLSDFAGQVVLVNFWATWCAPCLHEMPSINALAGELAAEGFKVVAISLDRGSPARPQAFLTKISAEHLPLYHEPTSKIARDMKVLGLPVSVILDRSGREIARLTGPAEWNSDDARALIRAAIAADAG